MPPPPQCPRVSLQDVGIGEVSGCQTVWALDWSGQTRGGRPVASVHVWVGVLGLYMYVCGGGRVVGGSGLATILFDGLLLAE